jgi:phosphoenolpyruvate synthase/pyruvate phosphate dikinase
LSFPLSFSEGEKIMTNQTDNADVPRQEEDLSNSKAAEQAKMDRIANELAERAIKVEQRYDREHGIFTK